MKQGRQILSWWLAIALIAGGAALPMRAMAAKARPSAAAAAKSSTSLRQFTGYVTALDKSSFTVEKRGKKPATKSFSKHAEMSTVGDVEKEARVTVYYRDEGGHAVAHRVVVKSETASSTGGR
jgi:hypothetical protein